MNKHLLVLLLPAALLLAACGGRQTTLGPETDAPDYRRAQEMVKEGRNQEALAAYLRVIDQRGDDNAPESHLAAGVLLLQQFQDPVAAIYHFRRFIEEAPNSPDVARVRGLIEGAKRAFAGTLPAHPLDNQAQWLNVNDQLENLQKENELLKAELATVRGQEPAATVNRIVVPTNQTSAGTGVASIIADQPSPSPASPVFLAPMQAPAQASPGWSSPVKPTNSSRTPAPVPGKRTHTVGPGDTLYKLAEQYYGNRSKWQQIYAANRSQLPSPNALKPGMQLVIP